MPLPRSLSAPMILTARAHPRLTRAGGAQHFFSLPSIKTLEDPFNDGPNDIPLLELPSYGFRMRDTPVQVSYAALAVGPYVGPRLGPGVFIPFCYGVIAPEVR